MNKLGSLLIQLGQQLLRSEYKIKPIKEISSSELFNVVKRDTGLGVGNQSLFDEKYAILNWSDWLKIFETYWQQDCPNSPYNYNTRDCDDYAFAFTSNMSMIFGVNSAGVVSGGDFYWYNSIGQQTGTGRHAFNTIVALNEKGELQCYLYEPMKNEWTTYEKDVDGRMVGKMASSQMNNGLPTKYAPSYIMYF